MKHKQVLIMMAVLVYVTLGWASDASVGAFEWDLHAIGTEGDHAYAVFQHTDSGEKSWVGVGNLIGGARVVRIDRSRVVVLTPDRHVLTLMDFDQELPALLHSPSDPVETGVDVNGLLNDRAALKIRDPDLISSAERDRVVRELEGLFHRANLVSASATMVIGGGEEWVRGMQTTVPLQSMGVEKGDLILMINGVSLQPDVKNWDQVLEVVRRAKLVTFAYLRGEQIYYELFQVDK